MIFQIVPFSSFNYLDSFLYIFWNSCMHFSDWNRLSLRKLTKLITDKIKPNFKICKSSYIVYLDYGF